MKKLLVLSIVLVLLAVMVPVPVAATTIPTASQMWYLDKVSQDTGLKMWRGDNGTPTGSVSIGASQLWIADEYAAKEVNFSGDGAWTLLLHTTNWARYRSFQVGYYDGSFHAFTTSSGGTSFQKYLGDILTVQIQFTDTKVEEGQFLAVLVNNSSGITKEVITDGKSSLTSPDNDPGYPLPEIAAGALLALGLAVMGAFIVIRRKKTATVRI